MLTIINSLLKLWERPWEDREGKVYFPFCVLKGDRVNFGEGHSFTFTAPHRFEDKNALLDFILPTFFGE